MAEELGTPPSASDIAALVAVLAVAMDRYIKNRARRTIVENAKADPAKPKCRWVVETDACDFCKARGGFLYDPAEAPSESHSGCKCHPSPVWQSADSEIGERGITAKKGKSELAEVDMDYINSNAFAAKFDGITSNPKADSELLKQARAMLDHRKGTLKEDLHLVSELDGETKASSTNPKRILQTERTRKIIQACKSEPRGSLVGIHNHPNNIPPTGSDIAAAGVRGYSAGIAVLHDGTIYVYRVNEIVPPRVFDMTISSYNEKGFSPVEAGEMALNDFAERGLLAWEKR